MNIHFIHNMFLLESVLYFLLLYHFYLYIFFIILPFICLYLFIISCSVSFITNSVICITSPLFTINLIFPMKLLYNYSIFDTILNIKQGLYFKSNVLLSPFGCWLILFWWAIHTAMGLIYPSISFLYIYRNCLL